ncbi:EF-hand domain-containing protein [Hephaestia mangrovi]|uniref:EF-hand domain-containing protein n=1 Tax=Hephaestia mangrovi TaxID=2873268 RepID=UPI001CA6D26C|nr:EF-hand domain-containing protein [Hephaestia mangrovi]MBY8827572.1 calcium-binding protein [Hephaestia mangrovi]
MMQKWMVGAVMLGLAAPALSQVTGMGQDGGMGQMGGVGQMGGMGRHGPRGGGHLMGGDDARHGPSFKPIKRAHFDDVVTAIYRDLDTRHDNLVTMEEVNAVRAAQRDQAIRDRFVRIDTNHDKLIEPDEFLAWQRGQGDAVAEGTGLGVNAGIAIADAVNLPGHDKGEDGIIRRIIGPVDGVVIAKANTNYDAGVSLDELLAYENARFDAIDTDHDGALSQEELRAAKLGGERGGWRGRAGGGPGADAPPPAPDADDGGGM